MKPSNVGAQQGGNEVARPATGTTFRVALGLAMVLASVVLGFFTGNLAVGVGLAILAAFRLIVLWKELRRQ